MRTITVLDILLTLVWKLRTREKMFGWCVMSIVKCKVGQKHGSPLDTFYVYTLSEVNAPPCYGTAPRKYKAGAYDAMLKSRGLEWIQKSL